MRISFPYKVIDSLWRIFLQLFFWWIADALGSTFLFWITGYIANIQNINSFYYLLAIRPLTLIIINALTIWQNIWDIVDFVKSIRSYGFRVF